MDKEITRSNSVVQRKTAHGRIETAIRVRGAKTKKELDTELKRLKILNEIDKSSLAKDLMLPEGLRNYQQLILIVGSLHLKSTTEVQIACKKLGYSGSLRKSTIKNFFTTSFRDYFTFDQEWKLTKKGEKEFLRLQQFI